MHTTPFVPAAATGSPGRLVPAAATGSPAGIVQTATQAAPADSDDGPAGCPCATGCDDMSACQAQADTPWSPADHVVDASEVAANDLPVWSDGASAGRAPTRPPIGLRVTVVTVARI